MRKGAVRYKDWLDEGFPRWLQERMEARGWSASDLARELGVAPSLISRWMTGNQQPAPESLRKLAEVLQLSQVEVLVAAGYLTEEPVDEPRRLELIQKLRAVELTHERYQYINSILMTMAEMDPSRKCQEAPVPS